MDDEKGGSFDADKTETKETDIPTVCQEKISTPPDCPRGGTGGLTHHTACRDTRCGGFFIERNVYDRDQRNL